MKCILPSEHLALVAVDLSGLLPTGKGGLKYIFIVVNTTTY